MYVIVSKYTVFSWIKKFNLSLTKAFCSSAVFFSSENYIIKWEKEKLGDPDFLNSIKVVFTVSTQQNVYSILVSITALQLVLGMKQSMQLS